MIVSDARSRSTPTRTMDAGLAIAVSSILPAWVLVRGDPLYLGAWYYLAIALGVLIIGLLARTRPLYMTGAALAAVLSCLPWMAVNLGDGPRDGLIGLGHLTSLPGAFVGALAAALIARRRDVRPPTGFLLGFAGLLLGHAIAVAYACNTVMACGRVFGFGG